MSISTNRLTLQYLRVKIIHRYNIRGSIVTVHVSYIRYMNYINYILCYVEIYCYFTILRFECQHVEEL